MDAALPPKGQTASYLGKAPGKTCPLDEPEKWGGETNYKCPACGVHTFSKDEANAFRSACEKSKAR